ncbi:hypothetical protein NHX12_028346 [Muraenolepis orangiensis]|uniref:Uncharacterized protein n=1 Tax=Muraenolepis orangiensis TaxID=630683 RepID=A0A9Q0ED41_9TELE|nr:hypothetical protein NHX12_028346 [Muraenolepis orangiensis]
MLNEFTDGEFTLALTSMTSESQDWNGFLYEFKSFCHRHSYDSLVVVKCAVQPPHPQVVVYSDNTDILNQICCELEESSICSLSGVLEAGEFIQGCLQVYYVPADTFSSASMAAELEAALHSHLKAFVERRSSVLACHPGSRTSSTEGVAGSVEFSQGSSGITDMYGSDTERTCADDVSMAGEMTAGVGGGGELVSPDSGMATIRSSRSSKESSVFLSDDSPIGEMMTGAMWRNRLRKLSYPALLRGNGMHTDLTSQAFALQPCENILYQWTRDAGSAECQAPYGYNYHHTGQRTDSQGGPRGDPDGGVDRGRRRWDPSPGQLESGREPDSRQTLAMPALGHPGDDNGVLLTS